MGSHFFVRVLFGVTNKLSYIKERYRGYIGIVSSTVVKIQRYTHSLGCNALHIVNIVYQ